MNIFMNYLPYFMMNLSVWYFRSLILLGLMTEIIIFLEDIDPVVFFGTNNSLLDKIRSFFPKIKIMARGNEIKCHGRGG